LGVEFGAGAAKVVGYVAGGEDVLSGSYLDGALVARCAHEFLGARGLVLDPVADGQGGDTMLRCA